ncbi:MAG: ATP-binding cassette domain-containing protein [Aquiluna sp.]|nr:ATP-binding cassette domain-containing protein [Aquiluna sp.]MCF8546181.1 ATP-binding cassette domain-containing protein [Aquiluna sp.]
MEENLDLSQVLGISDFTLVLGEKEILSGVNLAVHAGEKLAIIGASGAGKSSLVRAILGAHGKATGEIRLLGQQVIGARESELKSMRKQVGLITQQIDLVGSLSALENVLHGSLPHLTMPRLGVWSYPRTETTKAIALLEQLGLGEQIHQTADSLSGGQRQRVAICRAMLKAPAIVLADEPTAALDANSAERVLADLAAIAAQGPAVICVLHQLDLAIGWADRIVVLKAGQVLADIGSGQAEVAKLRQLLGNE